MLSDIVLTSPHPDSLGFREVCASTNLLLNYWDVCNVHSCTMPCSVLSMSGEWSSLPNNNPAILEQCSALGHYISLKKLWDELLISLFSLFRLASSYTLLLCH